MVDDPNPNYDILLIQYNLPGYVISATPDSRFLVNFTN